MSESTHVDQEKAKQLLLSYLHSNPKPVFKSALSSPARLHVISVKYLEGLIKCTDCDKLPVKCSQCDYQEMCYDCQYKQEYEKCQKCITNLHYSQQRKCISCRNGGLRTQCTVCQGSGKLRRFEKFLVKEDSIRDVWAKCAENSIPLKVLISCRGSLVVNETNTSVRAIDYFTDEDVYKASEHYLRMHENRLHNQPELEKLYQIQQLLVVPVSIFSARLDKSSSNFRFFIVGDNHLVYMPKSNSHNCSIS